jgi:hypothetical protein
MGFSEIRLRKGGCASCTEVPCRSVPSMTGSPVVWAKTASTIVPSPASNCRLLPLACFINSSRQIVGLSSPTIAESFTPFSNPENSASRRVEVPAPRRESARVPAGMSAGSRTWLSMTLRDPSVRRSPTQIRCLRPRTSRRRPLSRKYRFPFGSLHNIAPSLQKCRPCRT